MAACSAGITSGVWCYKSPSTSKSGTMTDWTDEAACKGMDNTIFFPEPGDMESIRIAKSICAGCKVREQCYMAANIPKVERFGIWGGLTRKERERRRRAEREQGWWADTPTGNRTNHE